MKITIKEIAELSGVSKSTVSKILNKKDQSISEVTRQRVNQVMAEHEYEPSTIARSLVTKKTKSLGVVIPDIRNPFFPELIRGVEDMAHQKGYNLIICNTDDDQDKELSYLNILKKNVIDGIIFAASSVESNTFDRMSKGEIPIVIVDRNIEMENSIAKVFVNNTRGGFLAAEHLIQKGCRHIAFISGAEESPSSKDRYEGYCKALTSYKVRLNPKLCYFGRFKSDYGYETTKLLLESETVDGIFCASDLIALGAMRAIHEHKRRIPEDIKLIGFDDIYVSQYLNPALSTIRQPIYQIGFQASKTLIEAIEQNEKEGTLEPQLILLDVELVERAST